VRFTEAYKRGARGWQMILSAETPIPQRQAIKIDPAVYDDFVGDYQVAPNVIGTVTRDGDKLVLKGTGWKKAYELLPLAKDTFFVREFENTEITFVRDGRGKVTHQLSRTNGQEIIAKKLN
jgi:D-alanyl-D-alanine-carboxypeptidase/D-alanyl-D-alanine-endopeptidase